MNKELLKKSIDIFKEQEKWDALFEIYNKTEEIMVYWLTIGATALRESFTEHALWKCEQWGNETDSRWFITELGRSSIGIGIGWENVELHLHIGDPKIYHYQCALDFLQLPEFQNLLIMFNNRTASQRKEEIEILASNLTFNPFSGTSAAEVRRRELAWIAAHETPRYVEQMGAQIRQLTDNTDLTNLLITFNKKVREASTLVIKGSQA